MFFDEKMVPFGLCMLYALHRVYYNMINAEVLPSARIFSGLNKLIRRVYLWWISRRFRKEARKQERWQGSQPRRVNTHNTHNTQPSSTKGWLEKKANQTTTTKRQTKKEKQKNIDSRLQSCSKAAVTVFQNKQSLILIRFSLKVKRNQTQQVIPAIDGLGKPPTFDIIKSGQIAFEMEILLAMIFSLHWF